MDKLPFTTLKSGDATIYLSPIDERVDGFQPFLSASERASFSKISGSGRKREFLATRMLLSQILESPQITYTPLGAPMVEGRKISISHCRTFVAIALSDCEIGIDIEEKNRDFLKIAPRYLNNQDVEVLTNLEAGLVWCSKEALFKFFKGEIGEMISTICCKEILDGNLLCWCKEKSYNVHILDNEFGLIMAVVVGEEKLFDK